MLYSPKAKIYFALGRSPGARFLLVGYKILLFCLSVSSNVWTSITPKVVKKDPTYGVSLEHKFHGEYYRHNFLSVCLAAWLAWWLAGFKCLDFHHAQGCEDGPHISVIQCAKILHFPSSTRSYIIFGTQNI